MRVQQPLQRKIDQYKNRRSQKYMLSLYPRKLYPNRRVGIDEYPKFIRRNWRPRISVGNKCDNIDMANVYTKHYLRQTHVISHIGMVRHIYINVIEFGMHSFMQKATKIFNDLGYAFDMACRYKSPCNETLIRTKKLKSRSGRIRDRDFSFDIEYNMILRLDDNPYTHNLLLAW